MPSIADVYTTVFAETSKVAPMVRAAFREVDSDAREAGRRWGREIQEGMGETKVNLKADTAKAKAELDEAARNRDSTINVKTDRSAVSRVESEVGSAVSSGMQSGGTAGIGALQPALLGVGITMAAGIVSALSGLAGLIPAALLGAGGVAGTLAVGLDGVKDAWDAAGKAALSSGKDQLAQSKAVTAAQRDLQGAVRDEARAQNDVATARKDALRQLQGLNSELRHGALDEAQAQLNLLKDQQELAHGMFQTPGDYMQAQLNVQKDVLDVQDAHQRGIDIQGKANTLRQQGVEGNPAVVAAEDRFAASIDRVTSAQQKLTDAFKPSTELAAAAEAMAKLSPAGQQLITTLRGMQPAFQQFKFAIQDALLGGIGPQIQQLATTYMPLLQGVMTNLAGTMNQAFGQIAKFLENPQTLAAVQQIFANIGASFQIWAQSLIPFASAFTNIMSVGSQFLPTLAAMVVGVADAFNRWTQSGQVTQWIGTAVGALQQVGGILGQLLPMFLNLAPIGTATLGTISQLLTELQPAVGPLADMFVQFINVGLKPVLDLMAKMITDSIPRMQKGFKDLADSFKYVADAFGLAWKVIGPILEKMLDLVNKIASPLHMIAQTGDAITNLFGGHAGGPTSSATDQLQEQLNAARAAQGQPPVQLPGGAPIPATSPITTPGATGIIPIGPPFSGLPGGLGTSGTTGLTPVYVPPAAPSWGPTAAPSSTDIFSPGNTNPGLSNPAATPASASYPGDSALLANVPAGHYGRDLGSDLTKGLGDCSSAIADLVNLMDGQPTTGGSMFTGDEAKWLTQRGFLPTNTPMPGTFQVGLNPEHTQATLPGGTNFNWGSESAAKAAGVNGSGAWDSAFTQHFYRPVNGVAGGPVPGGPVASTAIPGQPNGQPTNPLYVALSPNVPANQQAANKNANSGANQLGQDFLGGIGEIFGLDGSVFKDPTQFGLFKILKAFMGLKLKDGQGAQGGGGASLLPGGGGGGGLDGLLSFIPKPFGDLQIGSPKDAPGQFMPQGPGGSGGSTALPTLPNPFAPPNTPGAVNQPQVNNSVNIQGNFGYSPTQVQDQVQQGQLQQVRQPLRALPSP